MFVFVKTEKYNYIFAYGFYFHSYIHIETRTHSLRTRKFCLELSSFEKKYPEDFPQAKQEEEHGKILNLEKKQIYLFKRKYIDKYSKYIKI